MQTNGCGRSHVQGLFSPRLVDPDQLSRALHQGAVDALPFVAKNPCTGCGQCHPVQQVRALQVCDQQRHSQMVHIMQRTAFKQIQAKMRPHACTQDFG